MPRYSDPQERLEILVRRHSGCKTLERGDSFEIKSILPEHDMTKNGLFARIDYSFEVYGSYGSAQIQDGIFRHFDCDRNLSDKQTEYVKMWLLLIFFTSYPSYHETLKSLSM